MVGRPETDIPPLQMLYVYVTDQCNCRCRHCWIMPVEESSGGQPRHYLSAEVLQQVVAEGKRLGLQRLKWTGGEPTIHPELPRLLEIQRAHGLSGIMETNGLELTPALVEAMRETGVNHVAVSLDGSTAELHDFIRGVPGAYERALRGIRYLREAGYRPQLIMSLMRENIEDVDDLLALAEQMGAGSVKVNVVQPSLRGAIMHEQGGAVAVREILELHERLRAKERSRYSFRLHFDVPLAFRPIGELLHGGMSVCRVFNSLGLLAGGEYALCGVGTMEEEMVFGRVGTDRLAEVWQAHPVLQAMRAELPGQLEGVCGRCLLAAACLGSCVAQNYMRTRSVLGEHWFCRAAEEADLFPATRRR